MDPETLTEEQAGRILAGMNEVIRAGEEMRRVRAEMIEALAALGWTQDAIARLAGMSQPAVSKQMVKARRAEPAPVVPLVLDQRDGPWLDGRLWGLAEEISERLDDTAACSRHVHALARGRRRFTPQDVDALRRLVEEDLRLRSAALPAGCRDAYDVISRALDVPAKSRSAPPGSPSLRRTLARALQRDRLRAGG
ncbi:sigma-70 family RNA polymerase sigma factor [Actinacidiphila acidipaludis]|uniref:sigma-70 family RNA polymerase sigma factor n=1 Tax=Actinacidiphila acidipaludis TaxID=2873382 RepID=UPI0027DF31AE|nr:sigma-70 family RNA polymerase sigma factor [Streptomyces acidipaludis]